MVRAADADSVVAPLPPMRPPHHSGTVALRSGTLALLLPLLTLLGDPAQAGGVQGRVQARIMENVRQENITNGWRDVRVTSISSSNWNGEMASSQSATDVTLKMLGLSMVNSDTQFLDEAQKSGMQEGDSYNGLARSRSVDGMTMSDPVIRLLTSEGSSATRLTANGSDRTVTNARMIDRYNSSNFSREEGADSSSFGGTF
jgi:hypothetical protein